MGILQGIQTAIADIEAVALLAAALGFVAVIGLLLAKAIAQVSGPKFV